MAGLQGSGKTTATAKLARCLHEENGSVRRRSPPATSTGPPPSSSSSRSAREAGATVYERGTDADPVEIAAWARDQAERDGKDVLIVDTAGRLHVDEALMAELTQDQEGAPARRTCCSSSTP